MKLQAIDTWYAHHCFRSRLEARWAVFFDALGIPWEFEPQGFETPAGPYLPDFRLWGDLFAEVKPRPTYHAEVELYEDLVERAKGLSSLALLGGVPKVQWYPVYFGEPQALMWIDFQRAAAERQANYGHADRRPSSEELSWPQTRFTRAVDAACGERFGTERPRRSA